ncbi:xanthine dehydrogenase family protein molybdopterin-binding subunit [Candidatus Poriferisodalis sp.]|uniref:xanthine dehydrogenase family protein molybdopterin-binding subunit n=1 Tax=Candidatus Poriferisodalis sp. TaxID=3101277 RepID=UPI003B028DD9
MTNEPLRPDDHLPTTGSPFGEPILRSEDDRLLRGRGRYIANIRYDGQLAVAFVRSPVAHAQIVSVDVSGARAAPGVVDVATGADPDFVGLALVASSALPNHVSTPQPVLAADKVRYQGEAVAAVVASTAAQAADAAELVEVTYRDLPPHVDAVAAAADPTPPVHDVAPDNLIVTRTFDAGDVDAALAASDVVVERCYRTNRHGATPIEGRGVVAVWEHHRSRLTLHATSQVPYLHRNALAQALGVPDSAVRMVVGDVGGGFGIKAALYPEDAAVSRLAQRLGLPVGWVESRSEHMTTALHARDHHYTVRAGFAADGTMTALDAVLHANVGAYSAPPWTAGIETLMAGGLLTGPYKLSHYRCKVLGVATNTTPTGPYRGVARPATVFVMERLLDDAANELGIDPVDLRRHNLVAPADVPYTAATRLVHDSRTYLDCLEGAVELIDYAGFRAAQHQAAEHRAAQHKAAEHKDRGTAKAQRACGIGFACYNELTGLGQKASAGPRLPFRTGHESAQVRIDPSGAITAALGVTSQGQGLETTMAQVVAAELGVGVEQVTVELGDTDRLSFGMGAFASRQGVIGSGAATLAARAVRTKVLVVAAHLLEAEPEWLSIDCGLVHTQDAPSVGVTLADVAHVAYFEPHRLPPGLEPGLEAMRFYDPMTGTFAAGAQAAVVAVDLETGDVELQRIVCVEDTGRMINPMVVEGQMHGAIAQGVGGALHEHFVYDADGQLLAGSFVDYLAITADRMPSIELGHITDPAHNLNQVRGAGEGGTLGPYAAIANAVCDALAPLGITIDELPLSPARVHAALAAARRQRR